LEFKTEICMLMASILLFITSTFFFTYHEVSGMLSLVSYPFQGFALLLVGTGALLMVTASVSYSKRSKTVNFKSVDIEKFNQELP
jgi:hypothetical protein